MIEIPNISPLAWYLEGVSRGGIALNPDNGARPFPPRLRAGASLPPIETVKLAQAGTICSATRVTTKAGAIVLALLDIDDGGRLLVRVRGDIDPALMIGQRAELVRDTSDNEPFLTFRICLAEARP